MNDNLTEQDKQTINKALDQLGPIYLHLGMDCCLGNEAIGGTELHDNMNKFREVIKCFEKSVGRQSIL